MYFDPTNDQRAIWARAAANTYAEKTAMQRAGEELPAVLQDMLASVMHLCDHERVDFKAVLESAVCLYYQEVGETRTEKGGKIVFTTLEIGAKYDLGHGVVATVTGRCKEGYKATQEYNGNQHPLIIPDATLGNPHYTITRV